MPSVLLGNWCVTFIRCLGSVCVWRAEGWGQKESGEGLSSEAALYTDLKSTVEIMKH